MSFCFFPLVEPIAVPLPRRRRGRQVPASDKDGLLMSVPTHGVTSPIADSDLERRIAAYLASRSFLSFRRLKVTARAGVVTLAGRLSSFHEKQVARESCRRVAGVLRVVDAIHVGPRAPANVPEPVVSL